MTNQFPSSMTTIQSRERRGRRRQELAHPVLVRRKFSPPVPVAVAVARRRPHPRPPPRWKLVTQNSARRRRRRRAGSPLRGILKGFEKYYEDLPEGSVSSRCVRDSPECHRTNSRKLSRWDLAGRSYPTWRYLSLSRVPPFRLSSRSPLAPFAVLLVGFIFTFLLLSLCIEGSDTIGASGNIEDVYRSVLFTAASNLRDVGVPISVTSALFFPPPSPPRRVYEFTCSRRTLCALRLLIHSCRLPPLFRLDVVIMPMLLPKNQLFLTIIFSRWRTLSRELVPPPFRIRVLFFNSFRRLVLSFMIVCR